MALSITYNDAPHPSVFVPVGDFFMDQNGGQSTKVETALIANRPVNLKRLDLGRAPYVLYGVKYVDLVSLEVAQASQSQILTSSRPFLSKWLASKKWI